jgi:hypothetical protein
LLLPRHEACSRNLRSVAAAVGKSLSLIQRWSARYAWTRRVWQSDREREECEGQEETKIGEEKKHQTKEKEQRDAIRAGVVLSLAAVQFILRITEADRNLEKMPIDELHALALRAFDALISLQAAERALIEVARKLSERPRRKSDNAETNKRKPVAFMIFPSPCGREHEPGTDQWPCESVTAYAAFLRYADRNSKRSIRRTAAECGKYPSQILRWFRRYEWEFRVSLLDDEVEESGDLSAEQRRVQRQFFEIDVSRTSLARIFEVIKARGAELKTLPFKTLVSLALRSAAKAGALQQGEQDAHHYWGGHRVALAGVYPRIEIPERSPDFRFLRKFFPESSAPDPNKQ